MSNIISTVDMSREEWLEHRRKGIGGSDIPAVLGISKYKTPYQLWMEKTGKDSGDVDNKFMDRGRRLEPIICDMYAEETGKEIRELKEIRFSEKHPWLLANIDREIVPAASVGAGILEAKSVGAYVYKAWGGELPLEYFVQHQNYMHIYGYDWGEFAVLNVDEWELEIIPFEPDKKIWDMIVNETGEFWTKVEKDIPPPKEVPDLKVSKTISGSVVNATTDIALKISQAKGIKAGIKSQEEKLDEIKDAIFKFAGENEAIVSDEKVLATWKSSITNRFNAGAFKLADPIRHAEFVKGTPSRRFLIK